MRLLRSWAEWRSYSRQGLGLRYFLVCWLILELSLPIICGKGVSSNNRSQYGVRNARVTTKNHQSVIKDKVNWPKIVVRGGLKNRGQNNEDGAKSKRDYGSKSVKLQIKKQEKKLSHKNSYSEKSIQDNYYKQNYNITRKDSSNIVFPANGILYGKKYKVGQLEPDKEILSFSWAIKVPTEGIRKSNKSHLHSLANRLADEHELINYGPIGGLHGYFYLVHNNFFSNNELDYKDESFKKNVTNFLNKHPEVEWVKHEPIRMRKKRTLEFKDQFFPSQWHLVSERIEISKNEGLCLKLKCYFRSNCF